MKMIDSYLKRAAQKERITDAIVTLSETMGVAISTVHRWRKVDRIGDAGHCLFIITTINKLLPPEEKKLGVKDIAVLCNWNGSYRS